MKITFVGSFDKDNLKDISIISSILEVMTFTEKRSKEIETETLQFKGFTAKIFLNDKNKAYKVLFKKEPIVKEVS